MKLIFVVSCVAYIYTAACVIFGLIAAATVWGLVPTLIATGGWIAFNVLIVILYVRKSEEPSHPIIGPQP